MHSPHVIELLESIMTCHCIMVVSIIRNTVLKLETVYLIFRNINTMRLSRYHVTVSVRCL